MPFVPFYEHFPDVAAEETREINIIIGWNRWNLARGRYGFVEMYCDEDGCDCRRVFLYVVSAENLDKPLAVIGYGWEEPEFYARWIKGGTPEEIKGLKGPALNLLSPQSALAPGLLKLAKETLLRDRAYVERLKRHYRMFRDAIDSGKARRGKRRQTPRG
jgi:hypothetical protein